MKFIERTRANAYGHDIVRKALLIKIMKCKVMQLYEIYFILYLICC